MTAEEAKEAEQIREDRELKRRNLAKYYERSRETTKSGIASAPVSSLPQGLGLHHVSAASHVSEINATSSTASVQHFQEKYASNGSLEEALGSPELPNMENQGSYLSFDGAASTIRDKFASGWPYTVRDLEKTGQSTNDSVHSPKTPTKTARPSNLEAAAPTTPNVNILNSPAQQSTKFSGTRKAGGDIGSHKRHRRKRHRLLEDFALQPEGSQKKKRGPHSLIETGFQSTGQMEKTFNNLLRREHRRSREGAR